MRKTIVPRRDRSAPRGMVLILVLVVLAILTMGVFAFGDRMLAERNAARLNGRQTQARALASSGVELLRTFLAQDAATRQDQGGTYNNSKLFQARLITDSDLKSDRGYFTVIAPLFSQDDSANGFRYGLEDESARLNLNTLAYLDKLSPGYGHGLLMKLPGMTDDIADAILDWLDPDDEPREFGAEKDYYSGMTPPYAPKNGPLDSVEELLLVRGVTPELLFGDDVNRNGVLDGNESQAASAITSSDGGGGAVRGWSGYLTLNSYESNLQPDGTPRININSKDLTQLQTDLKQAVDGGVADFIIAYRQYGAYKGNQVGTSNSTIDLDLTQAAKASFTTVLDLVDAKVQLRSSTNQTTVVISSPITSANASTMLSDIMDKLSTSTATKIPGRINVNQAPRAILVGIPGMTEEIADAIISKRTAEVTADQPGRRHETWLLEEQVVPDVATMKALIPFINGGGDVFRAQIVGYFEEQGPAARFEVIIDASTPTPRIVLWRDITHLGRGYSVDVLGTQATQ